MYLSCIYVCKIKRSKHTEANKRRDSILAKRRAVFQKNNNNKFNRKVFNLDLKREILTAWLGIESCLGHTFSPRLLFFFFALIYIFLFYSTNESISNVK